MCPRQILQGVYVIDAMQHAALTKPSGVTILKQINEMEILL